MDLYKIKKDTLEPIERDPFKLEKEIQSVVESNVETVFGLEFVKSEFSLGKFRLDSICIGLFRNLINLLRKIIWNIFLVIMDLRLL